MPIKLDYMWDRRRLYKSLPGRTNYPVISNVLVSPSGIVTWTTDIPSTSQVLYGATMHLGLLSAYDSTLTTSHSVQLFSLTASVRYYFKVQSFYRDSLSVSAVFSFVYTPGYPSFILVSPDLTRWSVVPLSPDGNLDSNPASTGPDGAYEPASIVLVDSDGVYWDVTIQDSGNLETTPGGSPVGALTSLPIYDSQSRSWTLTVTTEGNLKTT